jgi:hypothetical protein
MYAHNHDVWHAVGKALTDLYSATTAVAAVTTTVGTCLCAQIVRNKCREVARLGLACPQHVTYDDLRYLNVWGEDRYRGLLDHVNAQMLQARLCALYAPLLSLVPLAMACPWLYLVLLATPHASDIGPGFVICLFVTMCWLIQRAVFDQSLTRYFETIETHRACFDFHEDIRSKCDEVGEATGLSYAYLRVLLATAPSDKPNRNTQGWLGAERPPFFSC